MVQALGDREYVEQSIKNKVDGQLDEMTHRWEENHSTAVRRLVDVVCDVRPQLNRNYDVMYGQSKVTSRPMVVNECAGK